MEDVDDAGFPCAGSSSSQPASFRTESIADHFAAVALTTARVSISNNNEKRGIIVDHIISSQVAAGEKDDSLLNTTTFSDPDFDGNAFTTTEAPIKPKRKSVLRDATNRIRNRRGGPSRVKGDKSKHLTRSKRGNKPNQKEKVDVNVHGVKQVSDQPQNCLPIKIRVEQSKRVATNEASVTFSEPEMTFFEDSLDFDATIVGGSILNQGFEMEEEDMEIQLESRRLVFAQTPVINNKRELIPETNLSFSTATSEGDEGSFMTVSFSLDDSDLSEGEPSDRKRQDDLFFSLGSEYNMLEINCYPKEVDEIYEDLITAVNGVANALPISEWRNYLVKLPHEIHSIGHELKSMILICSSSLEQDMSVP